MTLSDPNPGFKATGYLQVEYLDNHRSIRDPLRRYQILRGNPFIGGVKYTGGGKIGDFCAIFDVGYIAVYLGNGAR